MSTWKKANARSRSTYWSSVEREKAEADAVGVVHAVDGLRERDPDAGEVARRGDQLHALAAGAPARPRRVDRLEIRGRHPPADRLELVTDAVRRGVGGDYERPVAAPPPRRQQVQNDAPFPGHRRSRDEQVRPFGDRLEALDREDVPDRIAVDVTVSHRLRSSRHRRWRGWR
ncbi:hypothetical protein ACFQJD_09270 [Haloplanus sp. GCM10025708]|uniref:hypothetical protein n=1 Tax=Haloplanus sp. GCM10025708 TaxID=3252679 RepID=UPI00361E46B6